MRAVIHLTDPEQRKRPGYNLLLQDILVNPDLVSRWKQNVAVGFQPQMFNTVGAHLLAAGTALTGVPGAVTQLWLVPDGYSPARWAYEVRATSWYQDFLQDIEDLHEEILFPMGYDPSRNVYPGLAPRPGMTYGRSRPEGAVVRGRRSYLIDHIEVPSRKLGEFSKGKREVFLPLVSSTPFAWRLVASGSRLSAGVLKGRGVDVPDYTNELRVTEPVTTVVNLWEILGSESLPDVMLQVAENPGYQRFRQSTVAGEYQNLLLPIGNYDPQPRWRQPAGNAQDLEGGEWIYR